jgi:hypothetical protein
MPISRYPAQLQALYSELLDRLQQAEIQNLAAKEGSFATKKVKARTFWYFRRWQDGKIVETYVGPDSPDLRKRIETQAQEADDAKAAARARRELVRMLRGGGYPAPDARTGRLLDGLARAGLFRLRGVLVGTHAFRGYAAILGVRLPQQAAFTSDVDIAQFETVSIAVNDKIDPAFEEALNQVERYTPLLSLRSRAAAFRWRTADRAIEVELLTPMVGPTSERLRRLPALQAHAQPLRHLDYLIHQTEPAALLQGSGVLVNLPPPERYACHKLLVSSLRSGPGRSKIGKDIAQAEALIEILLEDRPEDLREAWRDIITRGPKWKAAAMAGFKRLPEVLRSGLGDGRD